MPVGVHSLSPAVCFRFLKTMTEDSIPKVSEETMATAGRQRKKRKWDQPAESLLSSGLAVPGVLPPGSIGNLVGITLPSLAPVSGALLANSAPATGASVPHIFPVPVIQQNAAAVVQKLNQPKIQDEPIAREIVINDAEPTVRYKLTKRQTQEEIQKCTGAVVITRGKYRPPNGVPDSEKPLYLHISAGAQLKDTAGRIKAVDLAAAMVEEILKQGQTSQPAPTAFPSVINTGGQVTQSPSTCLFLGFDTDPSLNIATRISGPNDQYINHIMNETGATVILRGQGSGNLDSPHGEELQQPLHLYLSSNNPKNLEDAKRLAENLLDTISIECGASRNSSGKVYNAVPPPQQLLTGVQSSTLEQRINPGPVASLSCSTIGAISVTPSLATAASQIASAAAITNPQGTLPLPGVALNYGQPNINTICYPRPLASAGTSYSGYEGIYPQATPLQQVAQALRQAPPGNTSVFVPTSAASTLLKVNSSSNCEADKRPPQKRKFQELPVSSKGSPNLDQNLQQGSEFPKPGVPSDNSSARNVSTMPPPKKLVHPTSNGMPAPPPRSMPPPPPKFSVPPPPKFTEPPPRHSEADGKNSCLKKSSTKPVPDNPIKLVEYGEDDDDDEESEEYPVNNLRQMAVRKPFWAL